MFQLSSEEYQSLRSQIVILKKGRGKHRKFLPFVFTEHGAIMAASVLNSPKAVEMSVVVVRAFVKLRQILQSNCELADKLLELEKKYDAQFRIVFDAIREIMTTSDKPRRKIGF